jgi:dethiobiotin synthetase
VTTPRRVVVVVGTATEVGKTWVTCRVAEALRAQGTTVAARKAAQSFEPTDATTDADHLGAATGTDPTEVCPPHRWYPTPMAPPMAAEALGLAPVRLVDLVSEVRWPDPAVDIGLFETAGGVASPQAIDADAVAMARAVGAHPLVLVADAGLGSINGVRLSCGALAVLDLPVTVVLNRFDATDDLHVRNRSWLAERDRHRVVTDVAALVAHLVAEPT